MDRRIKLFLVVVVAAVAGPNLLFALAVLLGRVFR